MENSKKIVKVKQRRSLGNGHTEPPIFTVLKIVNITNSIFIDISMLRQPISEWPGLSEPSRDIQIGRGSMKTGS